MPRGTPLLPKYQAASRCTFPRASALNSSVALVNKPFLAVQVSTGAAAEYQDLKIILAHAGAFLPYVASRIGFAVSAITEGINKAEISDAGIALLKRFYVDTALSSEASSVLTHIHLDT